MFQLLLLAILQVGLCMPPPTPDEIDNFRSVVGHRDRSFSARLKVRPLSGQSRLPPGGADEEHNFRYVYVDQEGKQYTENGTDRLEVSATESVSQLTLVTALKIIRLQCAHTPESVWKRLCRNAAVGVFTMAEGTTIFPEYIIYRDSPACKDRCDGNCSITCTGDGRKYDSLAGLGGSRGTCVDDNILCNEDDPYRGQTNILVHEFTHTIHGYALSTTKQAAIEAAFYSARAEEIWDLDAYSMSTSYEYFAEASGVFFHANNYLRANGGMSNCFGKGFCRDQNDARSWLKLKDPELHSLLSYTFTDDQPELEGGLSQCVKL